MFRLKFKNVSFLNVLYRNKCHLWKEWHRKIKKRREIKKGREKFEERERERVSEREIESEIEWYKQRKQRDTHTRTERERDKRIDKER